MIAITSVYCAPVPTDYKLEWNHISPWHECVVEKYTDHICSRNSQISPTAPSFPFLCVCFLSLPMCASFPFLCVCFLSLPMCASFPFLCVLPFPSYVCASFPFLCVLPFPSYVCASFPFLCVLPFPSYVCFLSLPMCASFPFLCVLPFPSYVCFLSLPMCVLPKLWIWLCLSRFFCCFIVHFTSFISPFPSWEAGF